MKSLFKKIALVLTLAMVIGLVPANTASAATTPGLKYSSKILYVDGDASGKYEDWCWTPSQNTKGYDVTYDVKSGKDLVTVAENGKITATGAGVGKAVVEVTYTNQKSGADKTANFSVYVKRNAMNVKFMQATEKVLAEVLTVGDVIETKVAKTAEGTFVKGRFGINNWTSIVTDLVKITSSDESVVKVDGFKLEAVGAGTATITVEAYQKEAGNIVTASKEYSVAVQADSITGITQTAYNKFDATFGFEAKDTVKKEDIIVKDASGVILPINQITWDPTGKIATVEMYLSLANDTTYSVTYNEKTVEFKASVGDVASVVITGTETSGNLVADNVATKMIVKLYDAKGIDVTGINDLNRVIFSTTSNYAWINGNELTIFEIGKVIPVTAVYGTGKYNLTTGDEIKVTSAEFAFTCVDSVDPGLTSNVVYTVQKDKRNGDADWTNTASNISVSDTNYFLSVKIKDTANNDKYADSFESTDNNKLMVDPTTGQLFPIAPGAVSVICKLGNYTTVVIINVTAERKPATISADTTSVTLTSAGSLGDSKTVTLTVKDQYGVDLNADTVTPEKIAGDDNIVTVDNSVAGKVTFVAVADAQGTVTYKLTTQGKTVVITVVVRKPNGNYGSTRFELSSTSIDTIVDPDKDIAKIDISAIEYDNAGIKMNLATGVSYKITAPDGKVLFETGTTTSDHVVVSGDSIIVTGTIKDTTTASGTALKLAAGSYLLEASYKRNPSDTNATKVVTTRFTVADSTPALSVKTDKVTVDSATGNEAVKLALAGCFTVKYKDVERNDFSVTDFTVAGDITKPGVYKVLVKEITLPDTVTSKDGQTMTVNVKATVNTVITVTVK